MPVVTALVTGERCGPVRHDRVEQFSSMSRSEHAADASKIESEVT